MKSLLIAKITLASCIIAFTLSASAQTKPKTVKKIVPAAVKLPVATVQEIEEGKALIVKSDCMACHQVENKLVGPSYNSVYEKYPLNQANVIRLSQKVITGGSGVWGTIPMPPHAAIATADTEKMVKYILSLKANSKSAG